MVLFLDFNLKLTQFHLNSVVYISIVKILLSKNTLWLSLFRFVVIVTPLSFLNSLFLIFSVPFVSTSSDIAILSEFKFTFK